MLRAIISALSGSGLRKTIDGKIITTIQTQVTTVPSSRLFPLEPPRDILCLHIAVCSRHFSSFYFVPDNLYSVYAILFIKYYLRRFNQTNEHTHTYIYTSCDLILTSPSISFSFTIIVAHIQSCIFVTVLFRKIGTNRSFSRHNCDTNISRTVINDRRFLISLLWFASVMENYRKLLLRGSDHS